MNCEGLACSVVEISWDNGLCGYRVRNLGDRDVLITLTSPSGTINLQLGPEDDTVIHIAQFDLPYQASFRE